MLQWCWRWIVVTLTRHFEEDNRVRSKVIRSDLGIRDLWSDISNEAHNCTLYANVLYGGSSNSTQERGPGVRIFIIQIQYIPRNMHTVFALLCFVVVIHWLIFPYPSGLLHWHCGNLTIAPVPAKQPWWIWINTSFEFIMKDYITTTKQSTTKRCAYFLGYTVRWSELRQCELLCWLDGGS